MSFPAKLKTIYTEGRLLPFIGAGVSMSVEWTLGPETRRGPSWGELVDKAANFLDFDEPELLRVRGSDLQILEYFKLVNNNNPTPLTNWLVKELQPPDDDLIKSPIHRHLSELVMCKTFYTTNFDTFLEDSFKLFGRRNKVIVKEQDMCKAHNGECEIIKFHGDLNNPDMLVLSEADYENRLTLSTELDYRFISDLLNRTVLFLGYSFRDPNVAYLFRKINDQFQQKNGFHEPKAYIVVKNPSNFEKILFKSRNIEIISADTENMTDFISELLHFIKS
jgi:hypothetical protein